MLPAAYYNYRETLCFARARLPHRANGGITMEQLYHFSAPGRTEISGNHTDHQHGCVLAAAVDMQTDAEVRLNGTHLILIDSEGFASRSTSTIYPSTKPRRAPQPRSCAALRRHFRRAAASFRASTRKFRPPCSPAPVYRARRPLRSSSAEF